MSADTTIETHFDKKILLQYIVAAFQNIFKPQASMKGFYHRRKKINLDWTFAD